MANGILISAAGAGLLQARPSGYLQGDDFQAFRVAIKRAGGYAKKLDSGWANLIKEVQLPILRAALEDEGFEVHVPEAMAKEPAPDPTLERRLWFSSRRVVEAANILACKGERLREYQKIGVEALVRNRDYHLGDDMGLGKTLQALLAAGTRVLWVCPALAKYGVKKEAERFRPDLRVTVLSGLGSFRWPLDGELVVINYDILPGELERRKAKDGTVLKGWKLVQGSIPPAPEGVYLVADEAHMVKSPKAQRTLRFRGLAKAVQAAKGFRWTMTGTEMLNHADETWHILESIGLGAKAFGNYNNFTSIAGARKQRIFVKGGHERLVLMWPEEGTSNPEFVRRLRTVSLKRMKRDVTPELPPKQYQTVTVDIDAATRKLCDEVVEHLNAAGIDIGQVHDLVQLTKIKGASFDLLQKALTALEVAKMPALVDLVKEYEEQYEPVVVFAAHRAPVDMLGKREGWASITGDTSPSKRQEIVDAFQRGELKGLAGTIQAMGVAVTLTRAAHILRVGRMWTPALNRQAEDRLCRHGQRAECVFVKDVLGNHALDINVSRVLVGKESLISETTEASAVGEDYKPWDGAYSADATDMPVKPAWRVPVAPRVPTPSNPRRGPRTATEVWAKAGIVQLAATDDDHAQEINGIGFSKLDGEFGHSLAMQVQVKGLTDNQWGACVRMCRRYRRQLPPEPSASDNQ